MSPDRDPCVLVTAYADGPLVVRGDLELLDLDLPPGWRERAAVALCRCGRSVQQPLCDGSHKVGRFTAPGRTGPDGAGPPP